MTAHRLDREVAAAFIKFTQKPPQPAQCGNGRHYYNTDGKRIVGDTCRCGLRKLKKLK